MKLDDADLALWSTQSIAEDREAESLEMEHHRTMRARRRRELAADVLMLIGCFGCCFILVWGVWQVAQA